MRSATFATAGATAGTRRDSRNTSDVVRSGRFSISRAYQRARTNDKAHGRRVPAVPAFNAGVPDGWRHGHAVGLRSGGGLEAVEVHHLGPRRCKVLHKLLLRVRARIDFRQGAQLRVRPEDQVDAGAGPPEPIRLAVATLVDLATSVVPLRAHVEEADEEV